MVLFAVLVYVAIAGQDLLGGHALDDMGDALVVEERFEVAEVVEGVGGAARTGQRGGVQIVLDLALAQDDAFAALLQAFLLAARGAFRQGMRGALAVAIHDGEEATVEAAQRAYGDPVLKSAAARGHEADAALLEVGTDVARRFEGVGDGPPEVDVAGALNKDASTVAGDLVAWLDA